MSEIDIKLEKIRKSCTETAKREMLVLKEENDTFSNEKIEQRIDKYKDELKEKYILELNTLEREYNSNLFNYEMEEHVKINKFKQDLISNIKYKIISELQKFVDSKEYETYLNKNIKNVLKSFSGKNNNFKLYITENDYAKYKNKLENEFDIKLEKIGNENIGGCIIVNEIEKISIDNTIKTNIEEKIKTIKI